MMKKQDSYQRTLNTYQVPDVTLLDQNGQKVNLPALRPIPSTGTMIEANAYWHQSNIVLAK